MGGILGNLPCTVLFVSWFQCFILPGANQFTISALQGKSGLFAEMVLPPKPKMTWPRVACTINYWICEKQHNWRQQSPHILPILHHLQNYTVGWGKVNQHNSESCCLYSACQTANKHKWFFNDRPLYPTKLSTHSHIHTHIINIPSPTYP